jgi:hypothetical protein
VMSVRLFRRVCNHSSVNLGQVLFQRGGGEEGGGGEVFYFSCFYMLPGGVAAVLVWTLSGAWGRQGGAGGGGRGAGVGWCETGERLRRLRRFQKQELCVN